MGAAVEKEWFYLSLGRRHGPVTHEDFCDKIAKQEVYIESTQVWKQGMQQWVNLTDAKPFEATIKKIKSVASQADGRVQNAAGTNDVDEEIACRGASRALFNLYFYFGWLIPMSLGIVILVELQVQQYLTPTRASSSLFFQSVPLILLAITTWKIAATRMQHAGYSKVHGLGVFVPIYNLWVYFICLLAPRNYKRHKKLGAGVLFYILLFGIGIAGSVLFLVPKIGAKNLSALVITESMTDYYKGKTSFTSRLNTNASEAASSKARQEQMKKQREIEREQSKGSMRKLP
ncbi:DUF4339 domain-containing protein [Rubritalea profundi]|uniref:GYF domain-containing protein n=1 Tax=Rubritalea profundi TaxID=1658618 RepID=A0A2S7U3F8_9BACT|nr:DUF4339 domain-containing protein [Rubritalea profundi]PQJ28852.1 hypothetical protein BSZ32_10350 [Rubritalea profundi]